MIVNLNQKETTLLKDLKSHEELCIKKYENYANMASDPELKTLFLSNGSTERTHLDSINQLLGGQLPNMNSQGGGGQGGGMQGQSQSQSGQGSSAMGGMQGQAQGGQATSSMGNTQVQGGQVQFTDKYLCTDVLSKIGRAHV